MHLHLTPLWVDLVCHCGRRFTGNARSVPQWRGVPACPTCWSKVNALRARLGESPWDTPSDAYPDQ